MTHPDFLPSPDEPRLPVSPATAKAVASLILKRIETDGFTQDGITLGIFEAENDAWGPVDLTLHQFTPERSRSGEIASALLLSREGPRRYDFFPPSQGSDWDMTSFNPDEYHAIGQQRVPQTQDPMADARARQIAREHAIEAARRQGSLSAYEDEAQELLALIHNARRIV